MRFENNVVVITGGSRGIGKATATLFAAEGATVIIISTNEAVGQEAIKEINSSGGKARFFKVDVSRQNLVQEAGERIFDEYGHVNVLVNNAGITIDSSIKKMTVEQFDRVISINLKGPFNCTKIFGMHMADRGKGSIINASSVVAHYGNFGQTNYVASKSGIIGMTKTWSKEFGPKGVRVNAVAPGFVDTDMIRTVPENILKELRRQIPLKRFADPQEIAKVYLFLASDASSYINGAVINVDGGLVI